MHIQTEQGCKSLGELCYFSKDRVSATLANAYNYVSVDNLLPDKKGKTLASSVPDRGYLFQYQIGDILLGNIRPYLKKIWFADITGATNGDVLVVRTRMGNPISPRFVYYVLSSDDFFAYNMQNTKGTKMPRGDKEAIMNYEFHVPPLKEQERIASALSAVDELLASLDKQIAKTRDIKQGAMQQLFSVLPRTTTYKPLGEVVSANDGYPFDSSSFRAEGKYAIVRITDIIGYDVVRGDKRIEYLPAKIKENQTLRGGEILVAMSGSTGKAGYNRRQDLVVNQRIAILRSKDNAATDYLRHLLLNPTFEEYCLEQGTGIQNNISKSVILSYLVPIPPLAEQKRIADVLTSFDNTIEDLEAKRQKYESIKAGMMQQLLTGTTTCNVNP